ncbi:MAG: chemotaxis protein CheX [Planctomycetes bacterium]|nr:chemotaxis protein CheX [Planctomycetota bacterium]
MTQTVCEYWNCVTASAKDVFASTCGVQLEETPPEEGCENESLVLAVIALVGDVEWSLFLGLPTGTAVEVAKKFAGFDIPIDSPDMGDAIGEMSNIFGGKVKAMLDPKGVKADISLPTVMRAEGLHMMSQRQTESQKTCYSSPMGKMWIGVVSGKNAGLMA